MQATTTSISSTPRPIGTGGFLDPDSVVRGFGVNEGMKIADFGCGAGYFTISLAGMVGPDGKVYALDVQEVALDNVMAKARAHELENIEAIRTNLEVLGGSSLPNESQDIVLLANILFQSNRKNDIIKEGVRVLKSGGKFIVIDWRKDTNGFGPPSNLRMDSEGIKTLVEKENLKFENNIDAGQFHFGLLFHKP